MQLNRNGFLYVLDRSNGALISAKAYGKVNWASHVDHEDRPARSRPRSPRASATAKATEHWPSTRGAKNWQHAAFSPQTGLLYANTLHEGRMYKHLETKPFKVGERYMFIENLPLPRAAGEPVGHIEAIDPLTAEKKWRVPLTDFQIWSAMLATGGGLLFTGKETGEFIALDADTGKQLWQFQTGSGINAMPVTYTHERPAIRHGALRHRRALLEHRARAAQGQGAAGRLGLDFRADAGLSVGAAHPGGARRRFRLQPGDRPGREAAQARRGNLRAQLLALPRRPHARPAGRVRPEEIPARSARALRQHRHARQEPDAALGRPAQARRRRRAMGLRRQCRGDLTVTESPRPRGACPRGCPRSSHSSACRSPRPCPNGRWRRKACGRRA